MTQDDPEGGKKLPYEKPVLRSIELVAEEVLVVGCKTAGGVKGFSNPGPSCTMPVRCHGVGS
ncbi:MAG: hypothetical protein AB1921_18800 [Thermodesulfobacteriota bacterium]